MKPHNPPLSAPNYPATSSDQRTDGSNYMGTHVMGTPAAPNSHPNNQNAAAYNPNPNPNPYVQYSAPPTARPANNNMDNVCKKLNSWSSKAEITANNIWGNLKTGKSVTESAWGKVNLTAKALTEGGFESLYKQNFTIYPHEKLKKTFACYLSTSTGPVAGTLYLSNIHVAFCSDRPLSFTQPSGMESWIYYKVMVPLEKIATINPVSIPAKKQTEKYIQISTVDGQDFWFMGFVNHEKASHNLINSVFSFGGSLPP